MKKLLLSLVAVLALATSSQAVVTIAQYNFDSTNGVSSDNDLTSSAGILAPVNMTQSLATGGSAQSGPAKFFIDKANAPQNGVIDASRYVSFTVTSTGNYINLSQLTFYLASSGNQTVNWSLTSDLNNINFATSMATGSVTGSTYVKQTVNLAAYAANQTVTFHLSFANATANQDIYLDTVALDASGLTPVPEPTNIALVLFGCTFVGVGAGRKFLKKKTA